MSDFINRALSALDKKENKILDAVVKNGINFALFETPVDSGDLRESIQGKRIGKLAIIEWKMFYAWFLTHGTGLYGAKHKEYIILPKKAGGVLVFYIGSKKIVTKKVVHPGIKANPFDKRTLYKIEKMFNK